MKSIIKFLALTLCISTYSCSTDDVSTTGKTINVLIPGTLNTLLTATEDSTLTSLTLKGSINAKDIAYVRDSMFILEKLDLNSAKIVEYTGLNGTMPKYSLTYPENTLPTYSFYYYFSNRITLKQIILPSSLTTIKEYAFQGCKGLTDINIPVGVTSIEQYAFSDCSGLKTISFSETLNSIGQDIFSDCNALTTITVNSSNKYFSSMGGVLFNKDKTELILYPKGIQGKYSIPNTVTTIQYFAFSGCTGLTAVDIPNSVILIKKAAFLGCSGLTSFCIPASVTTIGDDVFSACKNIRSIYAYPVKPIDNTTTDLNFAFYGFDTSNCILYVPVGCKSAYKAAYFWNYFKDIIEMTN